VGILPELIRIVINTAMQAEREQYLGAAAYERTDTRRGHANGYKSRTVTTRVGAVTSDIPRRHAAAPVGRAHMAEAQPRCPDRDLLRA